MFSTNGTSNITSSADSTSLAADGGESLTFKIVKLCLYALIFLVSVIGNALVCIVIARRRRMRTVTNYFILNLAIADLAITCICIPFDIPVQENDYIWPYGPFMCRILYPLQTMCMFASIFTLTAVSLNRFWAIVYPLRRQMTKGNATLVILLIWVISLFLTVPYVCVLGLNGSSCEESWPNMKYRKAYTLSIFVFQYLLPLSVIGIAYVKIGLELRKCIGPHQTNAALYRAQQEDATKVVRMLIIVTVLFALCVLPNNIMWIWLDFGNGDAYEHFWDMVAVTNIILFANSATNPVAYTICHEKFREEFKLYFTCDKKIFTDMQSMVFSRNFKSFRNSNGIEKSTPSNPDEVLLTYAKETVL